MKATRRTANRHFRKVSIPNEAIKDAWDPKATMTENYQRLGLAMDANDSIDGSKKKKKQQPAATDSTLIQGTAPAAVCDATDTPRKQRSRSWPATRSRCSATCPRARPSLWRAF